MAEYARNQNLADMLTPGAWNRGDRLVFTCPICGKACDLSKYAVSADGAVTPAFVCEQTPGCKFREDIRLSGWTA